MAVGDIITAARYNNLQSRVATIMGVGSGDDGYGQNLSSSQVAVTAIVNANDMQTLYTDIANGRIHTKLVHNQQKLLLSKQPM